MDRVQVPFAMLHSSPHQRIDDTRRTLRPARSLDFGLYQIKLTVSMTFSSQLTTSAVTYVNIIPSPITVNLLQLGSSMITHGQQQTLTLDPGSYSTDLDSTLFNASVCHSFLSG